MTNEEYDRNRDLQEAKFTWYLGCVMLVFFIFMECLFVYRSAQFGRTAGTLFLEILIGATIVAVLAVLIKDWKRLFKTQ